MLNHDLKCVFLEVPKTGSTSIRRILGEPDKPHMDIREYKKKFFHERIDAKNPLSRIVQHISAKKEWQNYFKFGFVRNPWDRTVSLYLRKEGIQMANKMDFAEFVRWIQYSSDTCIHPSQHKNQIDWFLDENGKIAVDFIGKFENIRKDWHTVAEHLGIDAKLPHANKNLNKTKHYTEYYTPELVDIIAKKFKTDIDYFNYEFGQ